MLIKLAQIGVLACVLSLGLLLPIQNLRGQDSQVVGDPPFIFGGLVWSPDGNVLAVGTSEGVWLHDAGDLAPITHLTEQSNVTSLDWSPDGEMIAAGGSDGIIQLWDVATREKGFDLQGHARVVTSVKWNPVGILLASGSWDDTIRIWDTATGEALQIIELDPAYSTNYSVTWGSEGEQIATFMVDNGQGQIALWDVAAGELLSSWVHDRETSAVKLSPDGAVIAVGSLGGQVKLFDAITGEILYTFEADSYTVTSLAWNPDSTELASTGFYSSVGDGRLRIWDVETGEMIADVPGGLMGAGAYYTNALGWSPDGSRLASTSDDGKIYVWDTETYEVVALYEGYSSILLLK